MKYVLLAYADKRIWEALPPGERAALAAACRDNDDALRQSGRLLAAEDLQSGGAATVRVDHEGISVADGPFPTAREQLVGIFFISARDLNDAIQVAARMPQARGGPIEVRPVCEPGRSPF